MDVLQGQVDACDRRAKVDGIGFAGDDIIVSPDCAVANAELIKMLSAVLRYLQGMVVLLSRSTLADVRQSHTLMHMPISYCGMPEKNSRIH